MLARLAYGLIIATVVLAAAPGFGELKVGDPTPGISATDQYGSQVSLPEFRNYKYVVLYFYPKDFTGGCTLEAQRFAADYPQFASRDAVVIGVSKDPVASHKEFCGKYDLPYTLLSDPDGQIARTFGAGDKYDPRSTFLIDKDGKIIYVMPKVTDIPGQNQILLAQLDKAGAAKIGPQVGKQAPDVLLPAQSSNQVWTLSGQKGRVVVLTFYRGWIGEQSPTCLRQAKNLDGAAGEFNKAGIQVVAIYPGTPQQADEFARKAGLQQTGLNPLLVDTHKQAAYAYNVLTEDRKDIKPATFIIDKDGVVGWAYVAKTTSDRPSADTVLAEARKIAKAPSTQAAGTR